MLWCPVAFAAGEAPGDRLDDLIAGRTLDQSGLRALAPSAPAVAWQLLDPASRAALDVVMAMPPSAIRAVRQGQTVLRAASQWTEAEAEALDRLAPLLGTRRGKLTHLNVHSADNAIILVDLELEGATARVGIAWPQDWAVAGVAADLRRKLGVEVGAQFTPLQDGSFENPLQIGFGWAADSMERAFLDPKRVKMGGTSLRLEERNELSQHLDLAGGSQWRLSGWVAAEDATGRVGVWADKKEIASFSTDDAGWTEFALDVVVPAGAGTTWVVLGSKGEGGVNFDNLVLRPAGVTVAAAGWPTHRAGEVVVHADPLRAVDPAGVAASLDTALRDGLGRLAVSTSGSVDVWLFADAAQLASAGSIGAPTADDPARGRCVLVAGADYAAACPLQVMIRRAWGEPGPALLAEGLPRSLAASKADADAAVRGQLGALGALDGLRAPLSTLQLDAATSFCAWLLAQQSLAAVKGAWKASELRSLDLAGTSFGELEAAWRKKLGG